MRTGTANWWVKVSRTVRGLKRAKLPLRLTVTDPTGKTTTVSKSITLKR